MIEERTPEGVGNQAMASLIQAVSCCTVCKFARLNLLRLCVYVCMCQQVSNAQLRLYAVTDQPLALTGVAWEEPQCDSCTFSNTRLTLCELAEVGSHRGNEFVAVVISLPMLSQITCSKHAASVVVASGRRPYIISIVISYVYLSFLG